MQQGPLFLARAVYRRRRLRDAARLLPILGLLLMLLPGFGHATEGSTARSAIFLFVVWALLIGAAAALAPGLSRTDAEGEAEVDTTGDGDRDAL